MAIFGTKKKDTTKKTAAKAAAVVAKPKAVKATKVTAAVATVDSTQTTVLAHADAILRPRITEKSGVLSQGGVYTFEVSRQANKEAIKKAVKAIYKVTPIKVALINLPAKNTFIRGRRGTTAGVRKAVVTVKKGEKIDFI